MTKMSRMNRERKATEKMLELAGKISRVLDLPMPGDDFNSVYFFIDENIGAYKGACCIMCRSYGYSRYRGYSMSDYCEEDMDYNDFMYGLIWGSDGY